MTFVACIACGGDDDDAKGTGQAGSPATVPTKLTGATSGAACTTDKDCGNGTCKKEFPGNALLGQGNIPAPGGYCSFACDPAAIGGPCGEGGTCISSAGLGGIFGGNTNAATSGQCFARCTADDQCRDGYRCTDTFNNAVTNNNPGTCQVAPVTDKLQGDVVGHACTADEDCGGGRCSTMALTAQYPGGYCTGDCLADADCGEHGVCDPGAFGAAGTCFRGCAADADCGRDGYRCRNSLTGQGSKRCSPGLPPIADGIVGKACTGDTDCGGAAMSCTTSRQSFQGTTTYPGGYCSGSCAESIDCGAGASCVGGFGASISTGVCYKNCASESDCRSGYRCAAPQQAGGMMAASSGQTLCLPPQPVRPDAGVPDADGGT